MGTLYEKIISLCEERGIKGGKMCADIGMSKGILTDLKMGRQSGISTANAQKIANYFNVSVGYLLGDEEKEKKPTEDGGLDEDMKIISGIVDSLDGKRLDAALEIAKKIAALDDDEVNALLAVVRSMGKK